MALNKFKSEKNLMRVFLIVAFVVFGLSLWFLLSSVKRDELGGSFISAMLLFISGYGIIIFIARSIRYAFLTKIQKAILVEEEKNISTLAEKFGKSEEKITKEIQFMINSGYLEDYKIYDNSVVMSEREYVQGVMKQREQARQENKVTQKPTKKSIRSEKCPNCGAKIKFDGESQVSCPYCGNTLVKS